MQPFGSRRVNGEGAAVRLFLLIFLLVLLSLPTAWAGKGGKGGKKKSPSPAASPTSSSSDQADLTNIPLPVGHEAKGLVLPDFDLQGRLRGKFVAGTARRIDEDHMGFQDLKITTFTEDNQIDLQIDMKKSVLDLKTRILSSQEPATVKRADFNIVGDTVEFDTNSRTGHMSGNVKMVITSQSHLLEKVPE